jgi:hypothetical protein
MILTAAVIVMLMVAMGYASNILNLKLAENEYNSNKQFLQTTGAQMDDVAWAVGRTQTVSYSSKFGSLKYQDLTLTYTLSVHTTSGWEDFAVTTGAVFFNIPVSAYNLNNNNFFQRFPYTANGSFLLYGAAVPVSQVLCMQKVPMTDGSYVRVVLVPTIRVLASSMTNGETTTNYYKFYLPTLQGGTSPYQTTSLTLTGQGISKYSSSGVDQVRIAVSFPKENVGYNSTFFNFPTNTILLDGFSTPKITSNSVVEFYTGQVSVNIGQV